MFLDISFRLMSFHPEPEEMIGLGEGGFQFLINQGHLRGPQTQTVSVTGRFLGLFIVGNVKGFLGE